MVSSTSRGGCLNYYYALSLAGIIHQREPKASERFDFPPLQDPGRPGGMERLAAWDDSSPLMSLTAINSTQGSRVRHFPPTAALLPGVGFLCPPTLRAESLELKLELWQRAIQERSRRQPFIRSDSLEQSSVSFLELATHKHAAEGRKTTAGKVTMVHVRWP